MPFLGFVRGCWGCGGPRTSVAEVTDAENCERSDTVVPLQNAWVSAEDCHGPFCVDPPVDAAVDHKASYRCSSNTSIRSSHSSQKLDSKLSYVPRQACQALGLTHPSSTARMSMNNSVHRVGESRVSGFSSSRTSKKSSQYGSKQPSYSTKQESKKEKVFHAIKQLVEAILTTPEPASSCTHTPVQEVCSESVSTQASLYTEDVVIGQLIGAGSFGKVYKGRWRSRTVGVKVIPYYKHADEWLAMEVQLAMLLRHPNVVRCYTITMAPSSAPARSGLDTKCFNVLDTDHCVNMARYSERTESPHALTSRSIKRHAAGLLASDDWTRTFHPLPMAITGCDTQLVMEYCDQGSLADATIAKRFFCMDGIAPNLRAILMRAKDIASGMRYLHSMNVCHGDLKCENVLLQTDTTDRYGCTAKVGDFGLCAILGGGCTHVSKRLHCGTISHSAPELLQTGRLCPGSDVYAFGIILWEMVTGMHPFPGCRDGEIVRRVCAGDRPSFPAHIPAAYVELAEACWAGDQQLRPSFDELLVRLRKLLETADELQAACEEPLKELHSWIMTF